MEKMNQVSVSEFMELTKTQMYDKAVEMVEKYNRLVDICNDGSERIADLVIERDNLSKGVQKLIGERDELIERHNVYTSALNKDIADKAAKIELLEKEIEGRKAGYYNLKDRLDTVREIEDHWKQEYAKAKDEIDKLEKESEKWQDLAKMNMDTICDQYDVCEEFKNKIAELEEKVKHQRENLDGINKTLDIRNKENDSLVKTIQTTRREIEGHESENARLSEKIIELKKENSYLKKEIEKFTKGEDKDHGRAGFKRYIEHLIEEEERAVPERFKERLNQEITEIFTKEEETEVNDIPCGEDAIE